MAGMSPSSAGEVVGSILALLLLIAFVYGVIGIGTGIELRLRDAHAAIRRRWPIR
jgi:hypothetical protein